MHNPNSFISNQRYLTFISQNYKLLRVVVTFEKGGMRSLRFFYENNEIIEVRLHSQQTLNMHIGSNLYTVMKRKNENENYLKCQTTLK